MEKHGQGTHCTKMGADESAENTQKCPKINLSKLSVQAQKFGISMKKASLGVRSPWSMATKESFLPSAKRKGERRYSYKPKVIITSLVSSKYS